MTPKQEAALRQAREALKESHPEAYRHTITAIDEALAEQQSGIKQVIELYDSPEQPAQQPVACKTMCELCVKRGYNFCVNAAQTTPIPSPQPSKPWVGLTAQDLIDIYNETERDDRDDVIRLTEAKLKEKNA